SPSSWARANVRKTKQTNNNNNNNNNVGDTRLCHGLCVKGSIHVIRGGRFMAYFRDRTIASSIGEFTVVGHLWLRMVLGGGARPPRGRAGQRLTSCSGEN
ncbi:unnamed protein product, partial [Ectocarpus fasciculatus]